MSVFTDRLNNSSRIAVLNWLLVCALLILGMVGLGGAVRLTGSGLSMVDWNLLMGIVPPIGQEAWNTVFAQYQQFPEYKLVNSGMSLEEFKFIFLMEYAHRVLGRLIGLVFFLPFLFFLFTKRLDRSLMIQLSILLLLGALQGGVGWYMVKSGLVDEPHVSQYRLTLHFMLAAAIYAYMLRVIVSLLPSFTLPAVGNLKFLGGVTLCVLLFMMVTGGMMAGTKAGFIFNTYPLIGGQWIPNQLIDLSPVWKNLTENVVAIQFIHRWLAIVVLCLVCIYAALLIMRISTGFAKAIGTGLITVVVVQVILGISTLVMHVPVSLGVAHQVGSFILLTFVTLSYCAFFPKVADRFTES